MTLKLYFDFLSQPSRALYIFLKLNRVPFEACPVALRNGEHLSEEFKTNFNRFQKVPFIHDGDFKLAESIAIVRYVAQKYNLDNHWYPKNFEQQALIDEYLEWQHHNTRAHCALYFQNAWLFPLLTKKQPDPKVLKKFEDRMIGALGDVENLWLYKKNYISGNQISVADIFAACEIEQPRMAGFEPRNGRPVLSSWLQRVKEECQPFYDEAHAILNKVAGKNTKAKL